MLRFIFEMLRQVPYKPLAMDGSLKVIAKGLENNLSKICRAIHDYSFDIFGHRVTKRKHKLLEIWRYIEQDRTHFTLQHRSTLVAFLQHVDLIIKIVANAHATNNFPYTNASKHLFVQYWTEHNLLPKDPLADNKVTLLDDADTWLADGA